MSAEHRRLSPPEVPETREGYQRILASLPVYQIGSLGLPVLVSGGGYSDSNLEVKVLAQEDSASQATPGEQKDTSNPADSNFRRRRCLRVLGL